MVTPCLGQPCAVMADENCHNEAAHSSPPHPATLHKQTPSQPATSSAIPTLATTPSVALGHISTKTTQELNSPSQNSTSSQVNNTKPLNTESHSPPPPSNTPDWSTRASQCQRSLNSTPQQQLPPPYLSLPNLLTYYTTSLPMSTSSGPLCRRPVAAA